MRIFFSLFNFIDDIKTCRLLLENNANINKTDSFSMTAIHWAASLNLLEITEELMKYLPDPTVLDLKNQTALEKAILNRNKQIVKLFNDKYVLSFRYREYLLTAIESSNDDIFKYIILYFYILYIEKFSIFKLLQNIIIASKRRQSKF